MGSDSALPQKQDVQIELESSEPLIQTKTFKTILFSHHPDFETDSDIDDGLKELSDGQLIDHLMRSSNITREQAIKVINALYEVIQHNLKNSGQFKFKNLFNVKVVHTPAKSERTITTASEVKRTYKNKPGRTTLKISPNKPFSIALTMQLE